MSGDTRPGLTPSQTVGPYFRIGLDWPQANRLVSEEFAGDRIQVQGRVLDGDGAPVPDAMLEIWQADADGHYHATPAAHFAGAGRAATDAGGHYWFETLMPGSVRADGPPQAPHINLVVFARGLLTHLYTRIYFDQTAEAHATDPVLQRVPAARRETLIAQREGDHFVFDVRLQGDRETVFLDV